MAETIGLASGVIGFIDIAARLTKTAIAIYSTMKDAPDDIKRLKNRSEDLQFILTKINNIPETDQDEKTARYWSEKSKQLVADFAEFNSFAAGLDEHRIKGKVKWYLSKQDRATKLLGLLAEDLKVLKALHQLMMESYMIRYQSTHFESIIESQNSVTDSVGRVFQMVNEIQATMVTREDMESRNVAIQRKPRLKYGRALRSSRNQEQEGTTVTRVEMSFEKYSLPIGEIRLAYRYKRELTDGKKNNGENFDWGAKWEFHPAPWISNRIFISQAMLQVKSGSALARPSISATLTGSMLLGQDHPIWENIDNMDLIGVQRLLSTGGVRINDYEGWGWTLLHYVCSILTSSSATLDGVEILKLLIRSGTDPNVLDNDGRNPMHYLMDASVIENPTTPAALNHLSAMRFMIESGAEFRPDDYSDPVYYVVSTVMKGCHRDVFIDDFNEYAVEVFSRDPESDPTTLGVLLSDMACGQFTQVLDLYLEGRPHLSKTMAAADPDYLFEPMIQEIASLFEHSIYDLREILRRSFMVCGSTLNISTANKILSSLSGYSPELVGFLDEYFSEKPSFDDSSSSTYLDDLIISGNQETLDILEKICVDTKMVRYKWFNTYLFNYDRAPLAEYPVWKKYVDDGVDQEVMDMLLTFGKFRSAEEMLTILDLGPDVNSIHTGNQNQRWTPLSGAVFYRDTDTVELLLDKGADVLLDWKGLEWQQGPISVLAAERGNHGLAEMLEKLEVEERASRGIPNPPPRAPHGADDEFPSVESLGDVLGTGDSALEVDEASPLITHGVLALGVFVAAFEAVRHLFLIVLGWVLNNLMLLWWVFCSGYGLAVAFLGQFGWMVLGLYMDAR